MKMDYKKMVEVSKRRSPYYFDDNAINFFKSKMIDTANDNQLFIQRYEIEEIGKPYIVCIIAADGNIDTIAPNGVSNKFFPSLEEAESFRNALSEAMGKDFENVEHYKILFGENEGSIEFINSNGENKIINLNELEYKKELPEEEYDEPDR